VGRDVILLTEGEGRRDMSKFTERLLQVGIIIVITYVLWQLSTNTIITLIQQSARIQQLEQQLKSVPSK
jgi:hypothetical protein